MDDAARPIEIFAPFGAALDWTKLLLFQPFNLTKWCVIGFAAFLANLPGGSGGNGFNFNGFGNRDWNSRSRTHEAVFSNMPTWLIVTFCVLGLLVVALVVLLTWVGARGRFIFADCVVRNRGAIIEPWKEFKREGNSLFLCRLAVGFIFLALLAVASLPIWWSLARHGEVQYGWSFFVEVALLVSVFAAALVVWAMVSTFLVPIMYRRRCGAFHGCQEALGLITSAPGPIILFFLFGIVLALAIALSTCAVTCATCCIALIPYVGTVILLPVYVFWMSYVLLFLRQFGPAYDVWENLPPIALSTPPIQTSPPTPEPPPLPTG